MAAHKQLACKGWEVIEEMKRWLDLKGRAIRKIILEADVEEDHVTVSVEEWMRHEDRDRLTGQLNVDERDLEEEFEQRPAGR